MEIGVGVIGLGWGGRVDTSAYRRVPEHFPDLGVTSKLAIERSAPSGSRGAAR